MRRNSRQLWCTKDLSTKVPECNIPVTEMFFVEAPVVSHEFRKNKQKTVRETITEKIFKQELGHKYYLLKEEEAYILAKK